MRVRLIVVGKLKERWMVDACAEYCKRLGRFCNLQIIELQECRLLDSPNTNEISAALQTEAKAILSHSEGELIALCVEGAGLSSEQFAAHLQDVGLRGIGAVSFVIGSSHGLAPAVKQAAALQLSFSKMTFPHQMARVMLLEQIYRAFQIAEGGKYHK